MSYSASSSYMELFAATYKFVWLVLGDPEIHSIILNVDGCLLANFSNMPIVRNEWS